MVLADGGSVLVADYVFGRPRPVERRGEKDGCVFRRRRSGKRKRWSKKNDETKPTREEDDVDAAPMSSNSAWIACTNSGSRSPGGRRPPPPRHRPVTYLRGTFFVTASPPAATTEAFRAHVAFADVPPRRTRFVDGESVPRDEILGAVRRVEREHGIPRLRGDLQTGGMVVSRSPRAYRGFVTRPVFELTTANGRT